MFLHFVELEFSLGATVATCYNFVQIFVVVCTEVILLHNVTYIIAL